MVQPINQVNIPLDYPKDILLNDFSSFVVILNQLVDEKRISIPLNLNEIAKIFKLDMVQLTLFLKTISTIFNLFTAVHKSDSVNLSNKLFPNKVSTSPIPIKLEVGMTKPKATNVPEYSMTLDDLKIIADLYYISNIRPLPIDIINTNKIYKSIIDKYPRFFLISAEFLQLTPCAKYFTDEFLKYKKIKAEMPKSLKYSDKENGFILTME